MKNKGFTIMELLAVIVILGILSSLAVIGVTRYRQDVKEKELINLHSTIEAAYDKYRQDMIMQGKSPLKVIDFSSVSDDVFKYFDELTYSSEYLTKEDLAGSTIALKTKGYLLDDSVYKSSGRSHLKDGTCLATSEVVTKGDDKKEIKKSCQKNASGAEIPSKEEIICIVLKNGDDTLINDYDGNVTKQELCKFFDR